MGDNSSPPQAPAAPDYAAANQAGVEAAIASLPAENQINAAAQLGQAGTVNVPGYGPQSYDFTGLGNDALQTAQAKTSLDLLKTYGPSLVGLQTALTNQADPSRAALNKNYEDTTNSQLSLGGQLDPSVAREVTQAARGGSAARGNILGNDSTYAETQALGMAGEQLQQQRTANAQSALGLAPVSSQFGNVNQATAPLASASGMQAGQISTNAGAQGAQFALGEYGTGANIYGSQVSAYSNPPTNPWMTLAGTAIGAAVGTATHFM